ncbi:MAG: DUF2333 family protein [Gammaproteobacteria bacterium]|jgi:hypothetical protein|nr:DUF2333 family protein [Gammaproteobacteria bacterium]
MSRSRWTSIIAASIGALFLFLVLLGMYWSPMPKLFWVNEYVDDQRSVVGYSTTSTLIRVAETLLDKRGGYITNDRFPPGLWLDNMPNWEKGVLTQMRDLSRAIRNDFSRSQSQSKEDPDVVEAVEKFFSESNSWLFPPTERRYREGIAAVSRYQDRLTGAAQPEAQFYARADNLREWLAEVEKRLGSMSRRLGNSIASSVINEELAGDPSAEAAQAQPDIIDVRTPWLEIDDVFFEARGSAWALLHFFRAVEFDFSQVLADKNAEASVRQIIRELEASLEPMRWPMVLNGGGYGLTANHSLVMANFLARANAAVINLRELLDQG